MPVAGTLDWWLKIGPQHSDFHPLSKCSTKKLWRQFWSSARKDGHHKEMGEARKNKQKKREGILKKITYSFCVSHRVGFLWVSTPSCFQERNRHARACKAKHSWRANFRTTSLGNVPLTNEECMIFMHMYKHQILTVNLDGCWRSLVQIPPGVPVTHHFYLNGKITSDAVLVSVESSKASLRQQLHLSRKEKLGFKTIFWWNCCSINPS